MGFMVYEHFLGAITWHKERTSKTHRKLGRPIALLGRTVAGIGWVIQADNTLYAAAVLLLTVGLYIWVDRKDSKTKTNWFKSNYEIIGILKHLQTDHHKLWVIDKDWCILDYPHYIDWLHDIFIFKFKY